MRNIRCCFHFSASLVMGIGTVSLLENGNSEETVQYSEYLIWSYIYMPAVRNIHVICTASELSEFDRISRSHLRTSIKGNQLFRHNQ